MIGKTTATTGAAGSGRSSLFLGAPSSVMMTPKLPRCTSSSAGSAFESSRAQSVALSNSKPYEEVGTASTAKMLQLDSGVA